MERIRRIQEVKIIRSKKFDIKPMYPEDACVQMELWDTSFFAFVNAETDEINVVYKRKGGTYGILGPIYKSCIKNNGFENRGNCKSHK